MNIDELDEAIEHAEQMAELAKWGPLEDEYQQQLDWLKELKKHRAVRAVQDVAIANMRAANLESEQLKSENASLRGAAMGLGELCDQLKEENAKLRELVRAMWFLLCVTGNDDLVAEVEKNGEAMWTADATAIAEKMRELGFEVE